MNKYIKIDLYKSIVLPKELWIEIIGWIGNPYTLAVIYECSKFHRDLCEYLCTNSPSLSFSESIRQWNLFGVKKAIQQANVSWCKMTHWAARSNHKELMEFFIQKEENWYSAVLGAIRGGHENLFLYTVEQYQTHHSREPLDWNQLLYNASKSGNMNLALYCIKYGAHDWCYAMCRAAYYGHKNLVKLFVEKGAATYNSGMAFAAQGGHIDLVHYFVLKGATDWNWGLASASKGGYKHLVNYFIDKGATGFSTAMISAITHRQKEIAHYLVQKGARCQDGSIPNVNICFKTKQ